MDVQGLLICCISLLLYTSPLHSDVGADPHIHIEGYQDGGIKIVCSSDGWRSMPAVLWMSDDGKNLSAASEKITPDEHGLFKVETSFIARKESSGQLSCLIRDSVGGENKVSTLYISETFYQRISRCVVSCTLIGLSFAIVWGCLIAMTIHLFRKQTFDKDQLNQKIKAIEDELDWRRARFNKADITLDGETAPFCVVVSNKGKSVSPRPPSADAEAVNQAAMVRGSQELSCGVHYWEVDVNSKTEWSVGIFEASADGSGQVHQRQWGLSLHNNQYTCIAAGLAKALTVPERLTKVGLFWDPTKGAITLYSVDGKCKLDTFNDELTGSVWPFLNPGTYHNGENRGALTICAVPEWD
ncbi:butyrophilin-like protein 9 isoform X2 [Ambystoma mexicanum]|uniref:butyrophilin-like protein 9 isoform X2 n=1 Tax=Ambystoma mexicanum TaxID=8296 RepID=UPI0037E849DB